MPHAIEEKGMKFLIKELEKVSGKDIKIERTKKGTFDLKVGEKFVEVKTTSKDFKNLEFISLTKKQFEAASKESFDIYLVCGLKTKKPEIYKINSGALLKKGASIVVSYEFSKKKIADIREQVK